MYTRSHNHLIFPPSSVITTKDSDVKKKNTLRNVQALQEKKMLERETAVVVSTKKRKGKRKEKEKENSEKGGESMPNRSNRLVPLQSTHPSVTKKSSKTGTLPYNAQPDQPKRNP